MTRALRAAGAGIALVLLAGCDSRGQSDYGQYFKVVRQSFSQTFAKGGVTLAQAAKVPYASMGWRLGSGPQNFIVLATDTNGELLWTSGAHIVITTRDGRITRTVGLPNDLAALSPASGRGVLPGPAAALHEAVAVAFLADFPDIGSYATRIDCRMRAVGNVTIKILGRAIPTQRVDQVCESRPLEWRFTDSFWLDSQTGFVWRTVQHIHPKSEALTLDIFRPPG